MSATEITWNKQYFVTWLENTGNKECIHNIKGKKYSLTMKSHRMSQGKERL
jgi:hypothetical protein